MTLRSLASFFFLATVFCCTFEKVHWSFGGAVSLADVLAICFLVAYAVLTRPRLPRTSVILLVVGVIGFVVSLFFWSSWGGFGRSGPGRDTTVVREHSTIDQT